VADISPDHPNFSYELAGGSLMGIGIYEAFLAIDWLGNTQQVQTMGRFNGKQIDMFAYYKPCMKMATPSCIQGSICMARGML
jgi:hypothetical protein